VAGGRVVRRRALVAGVALAMVVAVVAGAESGQQAPSARGGCIPAVSTGVLPSWARAGFFGGPPRLPHVLGTHGRIVAILFGGRLRAPPSPELRNKILWVSPTGGEEPLRIDATHAGDGAHARRRIAQGPGPSYVDLPSAGCWHLDLSWGVAGRQRDSLDLTYVPPGR
jgi:hypothetical protein